jgi:hypothetical protein
MVWLRKAVDAGYDFLPEVGNVEDFDILRDRADFKRLIEELEKKQAKGKPRG